MTTVHLTDDELARLRELHEAATPEPWFKGHNPAHRDPLEYIAEVYSYGPPGLVHLCCVPFADKPINEEAKFTAITGNGPTSEANAAFISAARGAVPRLLAMVADLQMRADCCNDACTDAFDNIAKLCGCPTWEYPGQVIRDVQGVVVERDQWRAKHAALVEELHGAECTNTILQGEVDTAKDEVHRVESLLADVRGVRNRMHDENERLRDEVASLLAKLQGEERAHARTKEELSTLRVSVATWRRS